MRRPEDQFVADTFKVARKILKPPLLIQRGAVLLYQVTVNNWLELTVNPMRPVRGKSAFQTDLCVLEEVRDGVLLPRVVIEFKASISTHDVITYSAKARKHKQVYPYLRYGILGAREWCVPGRVFAHNEALDFCIAAAAFKPSQFREALSELLDAEIGASKKLEAMSFGKVRVPIFRNEVVFAG